MEIPADHSDLATIDFQKAFDSVWLCILLQPQL